MTDRELVRYQGLPATEGMGNLGMGGIDEMLKSSNLGGGGGGGGDGRRWWIGGGSPIPTSQFNPCFGSLDKSLPCSAHWTHFNSVLTMIFSEAREGETKTKTQFFLEVQLEGWGLII